VATIIALSYSLPTAQKYKLKFFEICSFVWRIGVFCYGTYTTHAPWTLYKLSPRERGGGGGCSIKSVILKLGSTGTLDFARGCHGFQETKVRNDGPKFVRRN